jgi:hypothetical protein
MEFSDEYLSLLRKAGAFLGYYVCLELEGDSACGYLIEVNTLNPENVWWLVLDWGFAIQLTPETKITITTPQQAGDRT